MSGAQTSKPPGMARRALSWMLAAIVLCTLPCYAQEKDLTEAARHEIARRGAMVVQTGTIQSSSLIEAAIAPPADDSAKWYVTLVGKKGDPGFEAMKALIETDPDVRPWVHAKEPQRSQTHYQVRLVDDATQKDWLSGLQEAIAANGLPMVVLQPPRSGRFGDPSHIVKTIHRVTTGPDLAARLREGMITYIKTIEKPTHIGISQASPAISSPPPFNNPPPQTTPVPPANQLPIEWPPAAPKPLTMSQIQEACPGAPARFILDTMKSKETDVESVRLSWLVYKEDHPGLADSWPIKPVEPEVKQPPFEPASPRPLAETMAVGMGLGFLGAAILIGLTLLAVKKLGTRDDCHFIDTSVDQQLTMPYMIPPEGMTNAIQESTSRWKPPGSSGNASASKS